MISRRIHQQHRQAVFAYSKQLGEKGMIFVDAVLNFLSSRLRHTSRYHKAPKHRDRCGKALLVGCMSFYRCIVYVILLLCDDDAGCTNRSNDATGWGSACTTVLPSRAVQHRKVYHRILPEMVTRSRLTITIQYAHIHNVLIAL